MESHHAANASKNLLQGILLMMLFFGCIQSDDGSADNNTGDLTFLDDDGLEIVNPNDGADGYMAKSTFVRPMLEINQDSEFIVSLSEETFCEGDSIGYNLNPDTLFFRMDDSYLYLWRSYSCYTKRLSGGSSLIGEWRFDTTLRAQGHSADSAYCERRYREDDSLVPIDSLPLILGIHAAQTVISETKYKEQTILDFCAVNDFEYQYDGMSIEPITFTGIDCNNLEMQIGSKTAQVRIKNMQEGFSRTVEFEYDGTVCTHDIDMSLYLWPIEDPAVCQNISENERIVRRRTFDECVEGLGFFAITGGTINDGEDQKAL